MTFSPPNFLLAIAVSATLSACGSAQNRFEAQTSNQANAETPIPVRHNFLGAFFRPQGAPPFGVFSAFSKQTPPDPYPKAQKVLFGKSGYCDAVAENGYSIVSGYLVDKDKLANIVDLGVKWTRTPVSAFFDDVSHIYETQKYLFGELDSAECALIRNHITPLIAIEAGPVQYNSAPDRFSPKTLKLYKTPGDFAEWCTTIAKHQTSIFPSVYRYSLPGNEVNSNTELFPGGEKQIAAYGKACYRAIKLVQPHSVIYGFEINMDKQIDPVGFVKRMYDSGCRPGNCYDALSVHLALRYPIPSLHTPCFPASGGDYAIQCLSDMQREAHAPVHFIIGETGYLVPATVPNEETKATAIIAAMKTFAANSFVDGANYANIDECDLYPTGYFVGGCIVDATGTKLPGYIGLKSFAKAYFN